MPASYASTKNVILAQKIGEDLVKLHYETSAGQVRFADGSDLSTRFAALDDAVAGQSATIDDVAAIREGLDGKLDLTGGTMTGTLTFNCNGTVLRQKNVEADVNVAPAAMLNGGYFLRDQNDKPLAGIASQYETDQSVNTFLRSYAVNGESGYSDMGIWRKPDGTAFAYAPTPAADSNSTHIATTRWVNDKLASLGVSGAKTVMYVDALPDEVPEDLAEGGLLIVG